MVSSTPIAHASASLGEAFGRQARHFTGSMFDNIAIYATSIGIIIGAWIVAYVVASLVWYLGTFKWKRLCGCGKRDKKEDAATETWPRPFNNHDESTNKPAILPMPGAVGSPIGRQPRLKPIGVEQSATYRTQEVKQSSQTENRWHGHPRTRFENYVRLVALAVRVSIVGAGVILSFQSAGVNILSLAASIGVVSIVFSIAASSILSNILSAIYMYGTDKVEMGDYLQVGSFRGIVSAFRAQWLELTDDLSPWKGRQIHQVPNRVPMDTVVTLYPDGPPPDVIKSYFEEIVEVNKWRTARGLAALPVGLPMMMMATTMTQ